MMHFNKLSPAQAERLALLAEELGEAQQCIGKILRHGYNSHNPFNRAAGTNRAMLAKELGHVDHAVRRLIHIGDLEIEAIKLASIEKNESVKPWLHHQPDRKTK